MVALGHREDGTIRATTRFRQLIEAPDILVMPVAHDSLTGRIIEKTGFEAVACGGYAATASLLGAPDTSQLSLTEMADFYGRMVEAIDLPVFVDGDTGYGNSTNVARMVRLFERAGVGGLFIEDQVFPKRCGHMEGKAVIPAVEMVEKLKAALDARGDSDLVIMARTDALAVNGIDDAIERAQMYREAGADMLFVEAPTDESQMRRICGEIDGPCLANNLETGKTPFLPVGELQEIGYSAVAFPVSVTYAIARTATELLETLARDGTTEAFVDRMMTFEEFNDLVGLPRLRQRERECQDFARALLARRETRKKKTK